MAVYSDVNDWLPVEGIRLATLAAGIRYKERDDLVLMELPEGATTSAVFTSNLFCAAPVVLARKHLEQDSPRYLLINAGNANAGTGEAGLDAALRTCQFVAEAAGCQANEVMPFSTGVIGEDLPLRPFEQGIPKLLPHLSEAAWPDAAKAIMTTDTVPKLVSERFEVEGKSLTITGIAKGSGMICPDMATMLAYVATDALVDKAVLDQALRNAVNASFNAISVDGDTSTNDALVLSATGKSGVRVDDLESEVGRRFQDALDKVCLALARAIIKDGEGATKLVTIQVEGAVTYDAARQVAYTVGHSPLVKTALFASDPNWGRILAAVGRAGIHDMDINAVRIWLDDVPIVSGGGRDPTYTEEAGQKVMQKDEISIRIDLGVGSDAFSLLTCDLSFDYVKINAEYRT